MQKYFHKIGRREYIFSYPIEGEKQYVALRKLADTKISKHVKIKMDANPYDMDWQDYFLKRETKGMLNHLQGRAKLLSLWRKQGKLCPHCHQPIDKYTPWGIFKKTERNKQVRILVHDSCRRSLILKSY